jgi:hypothetical protein
MSVSKHNQIKQYLETHPPVMPPPQGKPDPLWDRATRELRLDPSSVFDSAEVYMKPPHARPQLLSFGMRAFQIIAAATMAAGIFALLAECFRRGFMIRSMLAVGIFGIACFGEMFITAIVEFATPRYVFPLWPLFSSAIVLVGITVWNVLSPSQEVRYALSLVGRLNSPHTR